MSKVSIDLCKSCLKDCDLKPKKFRKALARELEALDPSHHFEVEITSCLKLCPKRNLAFALKIKSDGELKKSVRMVARAPTQEGVIEEVLGLL